MPAQQRSDILIDMIKNENLKIIAEIGVDRCRMLKVILRKCKDLITQYWAIDLWEINDAAEIYEERSKEIWNDVYTYTCRMMRFFPQMHVVKLSSLKASQLFPQRYFDLVFLDADHRYDAMMSDIKAWLPLIKPGGFLCGHDYSSRHRGVTQAVHEYFGKDFEVKGERVWVKRI